jgi:hypothetical protein
VPSGGASWTARTFELDLTAINPPATSSVEAHVDLGSIDTDDANPCTDDTCGTPHGGVVHTNTAAGAACPDDGNPCTTDACNGSGACSHPAASAGTPCPDGDLCNGNETCSGAGTCIPGTSLDCNPHTGCASWGCDSTTGCFQNPFRSEALATMDSGATASVRAIRAGNARIETLHAALRPAASRFPATRISIRARSIRSRTGLLVRLPIPASAPASARVATAATPNHQIAIPITPA